MNKTEFEQMYGKKVTDSFFIQSERMYMAAGDNVDKETFCKVLKQVGNKEDVLDLLMDMTHRIESLSSRLAAAKNTCETLEAQFKACDSRKSELANEIKELDSKLKDRIAENATALVALVVKAGLYKEAAEIFGRKRVISVKLQAGIELDIEDQRFIIEQFR